MEKEKKATKPKKPKSTVKLESYSIKMVIPTGQYANIQPEIIVKADSYEEAHDFIAPHMNKLWKEYYLVNERRPEPVKPATPPAGLADTKTPFVADPAPVSSVALVKATQAIESCFSVDALDIIAKQVEGSTKLEEKDKISLMPLIEEKYNSLNETK